MVRILLGVVVGSVIVIALSLFLEGVATAMFHLTGLNHADGDHRHAALAVPGLLVFAAGGLLGGLAGAYAALFISRWTPVIWIVGGVGALYAFIASDLFANHTVLFAACLAALGLGCWLGRRAVALTAAPTPVQPA